MNERVTGLFTGRVGAPRDMSEIKAGVDGYPRYQAGEQGDVKGVWKHSYLLDKESMPFVS
ncbi:MAG: hypothetical protein JETCAE01_06910 [Anaerolineaceae bacterium]|nr:MAG: hypothetical protein JETCAE01_06910 [Anaerolineaceae bacterium]